MLFFDKKTKPSNTKLWVAIIIFAVFTIFQTTSAATGLNKQINYQAKLTNALGVSVPNGNYDVVFKIYDAASAGTTLWTGTHTITNGNPIVVTNGVFNVLLGSGTGNTLNLDFSTDSYYLGVKVGADAEMTPRKRLGATPQAFNANNLIGDGFIKLTGTPTASTVAGGTVYINPSSATAGYTLLGLAVNGAQKFKVDEAGNSTQAGVVNAVGMNLSGLTQGSMLFAGAAGAITQDNVNFFWDDVNNRLGIGTATPAQKFDVVGNINIPSGSAYMYNNIQVVTAQTALGNYFFGNAGNLTMTGSSNTATGRDALHFNTTGANNTADGLQTLLSNTTGYQNTAIGMQTLFSNNTGYQNTATGYKALYSNGAGYLNTANGLQALYRNTTGSYNTATGYNALYTNTTGFFNTANGERALFYSTTGYNNTAIGSDALFSNTTGYQNTVIGMQALDFNTTGINSTALGYRSGRYIAGGLVANTISDNSIYLGYNAMALADGDTNEIVIGNSAVGAGSNSVMLGNDSITKTILKGNIGIGDTTPAALFTVGNGDLFQINASGQVTNGTWNGSTIAIAYGGTNSTTIGSAGSVPYSTGSAYAFSAVGTAGQCLLSGAVGIPTWGSCGAMTIGNSVISATAGSILFAGASGVLQQDNANFFWDDTNNRLGIGTATPVQQLSLTKSLRLESTTAGDIGVIYKGTTAFIHNFNYGNNGTVTTDGFNTFVGLNTGNFTLGSTATQTHEASYNTGIGENALRLLTTGFANSAQGAESLYSNTTGAGNTANGVWALYSNTTGDTNVAQGLETLYSNTTGANNVASGTWALYSNTTGFSNSAVGFGAGAFLADHTDNQTSNNSLFIGFDTRASVAGGVNEIVIGATAIGVGSNSVVLGNDSIAKTILKGNVGIGITIPTQKLEINGVSLSGLPASAGTVQASSLFRMGNSVSSNAVLDMGISGPIGAWLQSTSRADLSVNLPLLLNPNGGNVGIGTVSPGVKLDVNGGVDSDFLTFPRSDDNVGLIYISSRPYTPLAVAGARTNDLIFSLAGGGSVGEAMRIKVDGSVGIGTATPQTKLDVYASTGSTGLSVRGDDTQQQYLTLGSSVTDRWSIIHMADNGLDFYADHTGDGGTVGQRMYLTDVGNLGLGMIATYQLQLSTNSAAKPSTNTWTIASDSRVKTDIQNFNDGLDVIMGIRPITYKYNGKAGFLDTTSTNVGVIAQEIINVAPYTVGTFMTKLNPDDAEETELYNFDSGDLTFVTINAIQEQQSEILNSKLEISNLVLKTDADIISLQQLQASIDTQLGVVQTSLTSLATVDTQQTTKLADLEVLTTTLQGQLEALQLDSAQNTLDITDAQLAMTNLEMLLDVKTDKTDFNFGQFTAENLETGLLTIKVMDVQAATIGTATIPAGETSVTVPTTAVSSGTKVFVTIKSKLSQETTLMVTDIVTNESFQVELVSPASEAVVFDWWIVEAK